MQGRRARVSQRIQELRDITALQGAAPSALQGQPAASGAEEGTRVQRGAAAAAATALTAPSHPPEQGRQFSRQLAEEKLRHNSSLLSQLRRTVQEDVRALHTALKHEQRVTAELGGAHKYLSGESVQEAREKLRRTIFRQVNTCNALLHQVRQRIRARDALRKQLQQLKDVARVAGKWHQQQVQRIRQLENGVEKTRLKIHAGQKVTASYLALRDALKTELRSLPTHVEMLHTVAGAYDREAQHRELMAADASAMASAMDEKDVARLKARMLAEQKELRQRCLAARKAKGDRLWLTEAKKRQQPRAVKLWMLWATLPGWVSSKKDSCEPRVPSVLPRDSALGPHPQASQSQLEHEAFVTAQLEKAKAAVQCSHLWDISNRLRAQHETTAALEQQLRACKEKRQALTDTLRQLELKHAGLKFRQPPGASSCRKREAELRVRLQQEEARLEQARGSYLRQQELLSLLEIGIDNLVARLHGITVPQQDPCTHFKGVDEKVQYCRQKLQHLAQRVGSLPAHSYSPDEDNEIFVKVRDLMEKRSAITPSEDEDSELQDTFYFNGQPFPSRADIKKEGLCLMERRMGCS